MNDMAVRDNITDSMDEAHEILRRTRARLIAEGRRIAVEMLSNGRLGITTGDLFIEMQRRCVPGLQDVKAYWLPVVFKDKQFVAVSDRLTQGVGHDALAHVWQLASPAGTAVQ